MSKFLLCCLLLPGLFLRAQDPHFSQAYSVPMLINPALAGSTGAARFSSVARDQWPNIQNGYKSLYIAYDQMVNKLKSGIGFYFVGEDAFSQVKAKRFALNYAVPVMLSKESKFKIAPAIEIAYQERKLLDSLYLSYTDEVSGAIIYPQKLRDKVNAFDIGTGLQLNNERFNFGLIAKHLTQPDLSFTGVKDYLALRFAIITDYTFGKIDEKKSWKFAPGFRLNYSEEAADMIVTASAVYHKFRFGLAYRSDGKDSRNNSALMQVSYNGLIFKFRYGYDFYTQKISGESSGGAHEATLLFNLFSKKKRDDFVPVGTIAF